MANATVSSKSEKRSARWKKNYSHQRDLYKQIQQEGSDILGSYNFRSTKRHIQHGNVTVNHHCMNVAKYSLAFSDKLHIRCNRREMIRGALLHDYFLYDWHDKDHVQPYKLHGFHHPGIALDNAKQEYELTEKEQEIIKKHMWPLTVVPPTCREAWIVSCADKWCSLLETFHVHKGHGATDQF